MKKPSCKILKTKNCVPFEVQYTSSVLLSNCKQSITSPSLLGGLTVEGNITKRKTIRKQAEISSYHSMYVCKLQKIFSIKVFWFKYSFLIEFQIHIYDR